MPATKILEPLRLPMGSLKACEAPDCDCITTSTVPLTLKGGRVLQVCRPCYESLSSRASRYTDPIVLTRERVDGRSSIGRTKRSGKKTDWPVQSDDVG